MKKKTILWLVLTAIVLAIIGLVVFAPALSAAAKQCTQAQVNTNTCSINLQGGQATAAVIGSILWVVAALIWLVAWIGALVRSARMGSWGWFVIVLILSGLGTLIYAIFGPADRPARANYPPASYPPSGYPPGYQPGSYQPTSYDPGSYPPPAGYPPGGYDPGGYPPPAGYPPPPPSYPPPGSPPLYPQT